MGGGVSTWDLEYYFLKTFCPKIKSVQNGLKCKKTHKIFFSSEQWFPQTGPESDGPGLEYLDTLGLGQYSTNRAAFVVFSCSLSTAASSIFRLLPVCGFAVESATSNFNRNIPTNSNCSMHQVSNCIGRSRKLILFPRYVPTAYLY